MSLFCCDNLGTDLSEGGAFTGQFQYVYVPCVAGNVCLLSAMVVIYFLLWVLDRYSRLGCLNPMIDRHPLLGVGVPPSKGDLSCERAQMADG